MDQSKYRIEIFWSDEDGGYIANVPALRYCSAFGDTYEEALREVLVAMELHLDTLEELDRPIPEKIAGIVGLGYFEVYKDRDHKYRWQFRSVDTDVPWVRSSYGYSDKEDLERSMDRFRAHPFGAEVEKLTTE
jgi:predicted RNase H-like HicB family nuclease/uncharacterized protein YegP (UPF0339 family)